jgi:hypothetical protein
MKVNTVTVVGANGTMGTNVSAIFASFGNAKVYMVSRDIEKSKGAALRAGKTVKADSIVSHLVPCDYAMLADCVRQSDLVFESVADNLDIKIDLYIGDLIGCGHPVGASGARMFGDLYKQVMYRAGNYQVPGAKNAMMLNIGGSATTNYVYIVGKE